MKMESPELISSSPLIKSGYRKGDKKELSGMFLLQAEHELRNVLIKIAEEDEGPFYRVGLILGGTEQLVAGSLKTIAAELLDFNNIKHNCEVDIWTRPWLTDGSEVTIRCECMRTVFKHYLNASMAPLVLCATNGLEVAGSTIHGVPADKQKASQFCVRL